MLEYLVVFLAGVLAHWFGVRTLRIFVFSRAMAAIVITCLHTLRLVEQALTDAHRVVMLQLRESKATPEEIRAYELLSEKQMAVWRDSSVNSLGSMLSSSGQKWAEWKDWNSAMKFLKLFSAKKDGE